MPQDYCGEQWNVTRENEEHAPRKRLCSDDFYNSLWKGTVPELEKRLQDIITQHTSKASDQIRQAFTMFTAAKGIKPDVFHKRIEKLMCARIDKKYTMKLFKKYDTDNSGDIDLQEFVSGLMPMDYTETTWYLNSEDKSLAKLKKKREESRVVVRWDIPVDELQRRIQDKVVQHTARSSDQYRRIVQHFTQAHNLTPETFKKQIDRILDADVPEAQCLQLFKRFDTDGSGDVDLQEFITGIMPKDYNAVSWNLCSEEREKNKADAYKERMKKAGVAAFLPKNEAWGVEEIEYLLQDKIRQKTSKSSDQFRQAFRLFASAGEVTPDVFERQVNKMLGTTVSKDIALQLFNR
jgi:Ca2+-binding EF-hand superfamily protein